MFEEDRRKEILSIVMIMNTVTFMPMTYKRTSMLYMHNTITTNSVVS